MGSGDGENGMGDNQYCPDCPDCHHLHPSRCVGEGLGRGGLLAPLSLC